MIWKKMEEKSATGLHCLELFDTGMCMGIDIVLSYLGHVLGDEMWYYLSFMGTLEWSFLHVALFFPTMTWTVTVSGSE
jgi:hypothetical protein